MSCFLFLKYKYEEMDREQPPTINYDELSDDQHPDYDPSFWEGDKDEANG